MARYYVLLGPPGAGKGTQAKIVTDALKLSHISSGDIFRENLSKQTELGKLAQSYMNRGELVPDDLTISMIRDRLQKPDCINGAFLDGFPRTPAQAEALDKMLKENGNEVLAVPLITVPVDVILERMTGRLSCKDGGHVYHIKYNPPKVVGVCDIDGSELYQREDDKKETVQKRIEVYDRQTTPLIEYYQKQGKLVEVDGSQAITDVTACLLKALSGK
ncbi:MAG: adenylate kinase [Anaerolinea sp.]|nr:adenylate kinase [Anaerolinea sp.]